MTKTNNPKRSFNKINLEQGKKTTKKRVEKKVILPVVEQEVETPVDLSWQKEEKKIDDGLKEIYQNADGSMPDMTDFEKKQHSRLLGALVVLLFTCIFLGGVAWLGFFVFNPSAIFKESSVSLSISGEDQSIAGDNVKYRIYYRNNQNTILVKVNLQVRYPAGFVYAGSNQEPINEKNDEWALGTLEKNSSGYVDVWGKLYGDWEQVQSLRVFLNYTPANFNSEFQKVASFNTSINQSPVELKIVGPNEAVLGNNVEFIVELNKLSDEVKNVALLIESDNFKKSKSTPEADSDNNEQWTFVNLTGNEKISVQGVLQNQGTNDVAKVLFKLIAWKDDEHKTDPYTWQTVEWPINLLGADLAVSMAINGALNNFNVEPGETLNTSILLKNNGDISLNNIQVRWIVETPSYNNLSLFNWRELVDLADGDVNGEQVNAETRRGIITWTSRQLTALRKLDPGREVNIDLSLPFKSSAETDLSKYLGAESTAQVEITYESGTEKKTMSSSIIHMTLNSDLKLEVRDEVEASGGAEKHKITWLLSNSFHELKDLELTVDLYGDISWLSDELVVPAGEVNFDEENKRLIWKVASMPISIDVLALQFAVTLVNKNPTQTNLTSKVKIKAFDTISNQEILKASDEIILY